MAPGTFCWIASSILGELRRAISRSVTILTLDGILEISMPLPIKGEVWTISIAGRSTTLLAAAGGVLWAWAGTINPTRGTAHNHCTELRRIFPPPAFGSKCKPKFYNRLRDLM